MKKLCLVLLFLMALPTVQAGVHLEPYLGYTFGSDESTESGTVVENSYKTPLAGARLGYGMLGFSFGVDYSMSLGAFDLEQDKPATSAAPDSYTSTNLGIYAGYTFPIMFKVWGTYFLKNKLELDALGGGATPSSGDNTEITGNGFALGVGWTGLPFLALNLEYRSITFDEITERSGTVSKLPLSSGGVVTESEVDAKEIILSVSVPLDF